MMTLIALRPSALCFGAIINISYLAILESTTLSQFFAEQGLKIRIRKEVRPKK